MMRRAWVAATAALVIGWPAFVAWAVAAAWLGSGRMGNVAGVLFFTLLPATFAYAFWTADNRPAPNLPMSMRRRLRDEERRIRMAAEIERLEREAGIR